MTDIDYIKAGVNIVDIIGQYVQLKKSGDNYFGLCPFHNEKSPSFNVVESKQFFHCHGCGASGDVIKFVQEYSGVDFREAVKSIGGELDLMPGKKVAENLKKASKITGYKLPPDHKEDGEMAARVINKCRLENIFGVDFFRHKSGFCLPIYSSYYELVNAVDFSYGKEMRFVAGGYSYNGFTPIRVNDSPNFLACVTLSDGRAIAAEYKINVAVCWHSLVIKYLCKWNYSELNIKPGLRDCDDDWIATNMPWVSISDDVPPKIKKMEVKACTN